MKIINFRKICILLSAFFIVSLSFSYANAASLSDLLKKKDTLNKQAQKYDSAAKNKESEASKLENQINNLESDIKDTESEILETGSKIDETSRTIDSLGTDISQKVKELEALKLKLNDSIKEIYRTSGSADYELLFGSSSFSELMNQSKYIQSIETQVKTLHTKVEDTKKSLENQKSETEAKKAELDQLKSQQQAHMTSANYQKTQKDKLLGMTVEQKNAYEQEAEKAKKEAAGVEEQIRAILASRSAGSDGTFGKGPGVGSRVNKGDYVGIQGSTGFSTGDHVHFEVDLKGPSQSWTSPWPYLNNGTITWPLKKYTITQDYGVANNWYKCGYHMGIDIAGPIGSVVYAPADGMVVLNESFGGYGNAWAMKVDNGPYVLLGHMR